MTEKKQKRIKETTVKEEGGGEGEGEQLKS